MFSMFSVIGSCGNEAVAGMGTNAGAGRGGEIAGGEKTGGAGGGL